MLQHSVIFVIILLSLVMAYRRGTRGERGYAYAWLACACINALLLVRLLFFA